MKLGEHRGPDLTDYARLKAMTEEDIQRGIASDPDNPEMTDADWAKAVLVIPAKAMGLIQDLYLMSNLSPKTTGLPFVVWISPRGNARHDVRVKVSPNSKPEEFVIVAIRPEVKVLKGSLASPDLRRLTEWVQQNLDALVGYWEGDIEYTEDVLALLTPIQK